MNILRLLLSLFVVTTFAACGTKGDAPATSSAAETVIRTRDISGMQQILGATFAQQGWEVAAQTYNGIIFSQAMRPEDSARYFGPSPAGTAGGFAQYEFVFKPLETGRIRVRARFIVVSPAVNEGTQVADATDAKVRQELQDLLGKLKSSMER